MSWCWLGPIYMFMNSHLVELFFPLHLRDFRPLSTPKKQCFIHPDTQEWSKNEPAWQVRIPLQPQVSPPPYLQWHPASTWSKPQGSQKTQIISDQEQLQNQTACGRQNKWRTKKQHSFTQPPFAFGFPAWRRRAASFKRCGHLCFYSQASTLSLASGSALYTGEQWNEMAPISILSSA